MFAYTDLESSRRRQGIEQIELDNVILSSLSFGNKRKVIITVNGDIRSGMRIVLLCGFCSNTRIVGSIVAPS
jgi:hypothetical protein